MDIMHESLHGQDITILGPYKPWGYHAQNGGDSSNYPTHSGRILDLKDRRPSGIEYFKNYLVPRITNYEGIVSVPSHDPDKTVSGVRTLAEKLALEVGRNDVSGQLVRHTKIQKLADGGNRSLEVHLNSISLANPNHIAGKSVLLIDDVMTTGHSLLACRQILLDGGATAVKCLALGRTTY